MQSTPEANRKLRRERWKLLIQLQRMTEKPMILLSVVWFALLIFELTYGLSRPLEVLGQVIWALFIVDFVTHLIIAPDRAQYLRKNWLTALALVLPALRMLRAVRGLRSIRGLRALGTARAARGAGVARLVTTANRGIRTVRRMFGRSGAGPIALMSLLIVLLSAAGALYFERDHPGSQIDSFTKALWWASMLLTTMGSEYAVKSAEARVVAFLLSLYALAVFGYITAAIASYLVGLDARSDGSRAEVATRKDAPATAAQVEALRREIVGLRDELREVRGNGDSLRTDKEGPGQRKAA